MQSLYAALSETTLKLSLVCEYEPQYENNDMFRISNTETIYRQQVFTERYGWAIELVPSLQDAFGKQCGHLNKTER